MKMAWSLFITLTLSLSRHKPYLGGEGTLVARVLLLIDELLLGRTKLRSDS
jgi:hypothetical protein